MITRQTADKLLAVARQARDRADYKIKAGIDTSEMTRQELESMLALVDQCQTEMRGQEAPDAATRQLENLVQIQTGQIRNLKRAFDMLEIAARVVIRAKPLEVSETVTALELTLKDCERFYRSERLVNDTTRQQAYAIDQALREREQVDIGLKSIESPEIDADRFMSACHEFVRRTGAHPGLGKPK